MLNPQYAAKLFYGQERASSFSQLQSMEQVVTAQIRRVAAPLVPTY
jgi:hypothetical protein